MLLSEKPRLIAVDLDNTLMRRDKSLSAYTVSVINRCRSHGIQLAFSTARSATACRRVAAQVAPEYIVSCGGALVQKQAQVLAQRGLSSAQSSEIVHYCLGLPSAGLVQAEMADGRYLINWEGLDELTGDYAHGSFHHFPQPLDGDALKLVIQLEEEQEQRQAMRRFAEFEVHRYVGSSWLFFAAAEATKWRGVLDVAEDMGIEPQQVVAFGDDTGDMEMLRCSGTGVAMGNALPQVKQAADAVCADCDSDGVARWLEENLLLG